MIENVEAPKFPTFENRVETFLPKGAVAKNLSEVAELLSKGSEVVFFTDSNSVAAFNELTPETLNVLQHIAKFRTDDVLGDVRNSLNGLPAGTEGIKEAILSDIKKILEACPEKKLEGIVFTTQFPSDTGPEAGPWHQDDLGRRIRVLRTYTTQSTEYASDTNPDPRAVISPPVGSFSFLTKEAIHRRPALPPTTARVTLLVEIL